MTLDDPAGLVDRFHRTLVEEIRSNAPRYLREPFTVAEIYQQLVPYHTHRNAIGVEMNADYEDALLRLLAGQGGYVELESDAAVRKIREELETQNPDTGLYREFAAAEVRLNPEKLPGDGGGHRPPGRTEAEAEFGEGGSDQPAFHGGAPMEKAGVGRVRTLGEDEEARAPEADEGPGGVEPPARRARACRACGSPLPDRDDVVYCPRCGADQRMVSCPGCGTELEGEWRFCVACGEEV